jgi:hypothetical protein
MKMDEIVLSYLYMFHMCFKYITFVCRNYELMKNEFYMIFITKSWEAKFVMYRLKNQNQLVRYSLCVHDLVKPKNIKL